MFPERDGLAPPTARALPVNALAGRCAALPSPFPLAILTEVSSAQNTQQKLTVCKTFPRQPV